MLMENCRKKKKIQVDRKILVVNRIIQVVDKAAKVNRTTRVVRKITDRMATMETEMQHRLQQLQTQGMLPM